jgi:hypothetical protein
MSWRSSRTSWARTERFGGRRGARTQPVRSPARVRAGVAICAIVAAVVAPSLALGSAAANTKSFGDTRGENFLAPDIVSTTVSNTDAGDLRFAITVSNRPVFGRDMLILVFVDTKKGGDPDSNGADYVIQVESGLPLLFRWNGSDFLRAPSDGGLGYRYPSTGPIIELSSAALGSPKTIKFRELVGSGATRNGQGDTVYTNFKADASPNVETQGFAFDVVTHLRLQAGKTALSPSLPRAGGPVAVVLEVAANDTGPLTKGKVACEARLGGKPLGTQSTKVGNGVATCGFKLPAGSKGKQLKGTMTVTSRGLTVRRPFSTTVG